MAWTKASNACSSIYGALGDLKQFDSLTTFEMAGPLTMQDLQFYNTSASGDLNNANATAQANRLDNTLSNSYAGVYKDGFDSNNAITTLTSIFLRRSSFQAC